MGIIKDKIIEENGLLVQRFSGHLSKMDMAAYFTALYNNPQYLKVSTIFSDFSKANVALTEDEIIEVAYFIIAHAPRVRYVVNSILVDAPLVTAYSMLYQEVMKEMPMYECSIFSTFEQAARYIQYDISELNKIIKKAHQ